MLRWGKEKNSTFVSHRRWFYCGDLQGPEFGGFMPEPRNVGAFLFPPGGNNGPNINWAIQQRHRIDSSLFDLGMELRYIYFLRLLFYKASLYSHHCVLFRLLTGLNVGLVYKLFWKWFWTNIRYIVAEVLIWSSYA